MRRQEQKRYRPGVCDLFDREGKCKYGDNCRFAHLDKYGKDLRKRREPSRRDRPHDSKKNSEREKKNDSKSGKKSTKSANETESEKPTSSTKDSSKENEDSKTEGEKNENGDKTVVATEIVEEEEESEEIPANNDVDDDVLNLHDSMVEKSINKIAAEKPKSAKPAEPKKSNKVSKMTCLNYGHWSIT